MDHRIRARTTGQGFSSADGSGGRRRHLRMLLVGTIAALVVVALVAILRWVRSARPPLAAALPPDIELYVEAPSLQILASELGAARLRLDGMNEVASFDAVAGDVAAVFDLPVDD